MKTVKFIKIAKSKTTDKKFAMVGVVDSEALTNDQVVCITRASLNEKGLELFESLEKGDDCPVTVEFSGEQLEGTSIEKVRINAIVEA